MSKSNDCSTCDSSGEYLKYSPRVYAHLNKMDLLNTWTRQVSSSLSSLNKSPAEHYLANILKLQKYIKLPKTHPDFITEIQRINRCSDTEWMREMQTIRELHPYLKIQTPVYFSKNRMLNQITNKQSNNTDDADDDPSDRKKLLLGMGVQGCINDNGLIEYANDGTTTDYFPKSSLPTGLSQCPERVE